MDAFYTDVRPSLAAWRESRGLPGNPMTACAGSGYRPRIATERVGGQQASWGAYPPHPPSAGVTPDPGGSYTRARPRQAHDPAAGVKPPATTSVPLRESAYPPPPPPHHHKHHMTDPFRFRPHTASPDNQAELAHRTEPRARRALRAGRQVARGITDDLS